MGNILAKIQFDIDLKLDDTTLRGNLMKLWRFEGTTEEFNAVSEALIGKSAQREESGEATEAAQALQPWERFATVSQAVEILSRRPLSDNMSNVLRDLYRAGAERRTSDDLKGLTGLNADQFRGLLGAFGRRTKYTLTKGERFLDDHWDSSIAQYTWTLPETAREAMRQLKLV